MNNDVPVKPTSEMGKRQLVNVVERWLRMAGCDVELTRYNDRTYHLSIRIPESSGDIHGERLKALSDQTT